MPLLLIFVMSLAVNAQIRTSEARPDLRAHTTLFGACWASMSVKQLASLDSVAPVSRPCMPSAQSHQDTHSPFQASLHAVASRMSLAQLDHPSISGGLCHGILQRHLHAALCSISNTILPRSCVSFPKNCGPSSNFSSYEASKFMCHFWCASATAR